MDINVNIYMYYQLDKELIIRKNVVTNRDKFGL